MPNMSHCMCTNTLDDMRQINADIEPEDLSDAELISALDLLQECARFINNYGSLILEEGADREADGNKMKIKSSKTREAIIRLLGEEAIAD